MPDTGVLSHVASFRETFISQASWGGRAPAPPAPACPARQERVHVIFAARRRWQSTHHLSLSLTEDRPWIIGELAIFLAF